MPGYLDAVVRPDQHVNPVLRHLGVVVSRVNRDEAVLACTVTPALTQGAGVLAGGIIATLLDEAMAHAALARLGEVPIATTELSVRYFAPVKSGDSVLARAWVYREGSRLVTIEAELVRAPEILAAKAVATFMRV